MAPRRRFLVAAGLCAAAGLVFSAVSTRDFVAHLDRQVHAITCSIVPGMGALDSAGTSGCYAAMMSPWSSLLRTHLWGGIPVAMLSMSVFAFLLFFAADLLARRREGSRNDARFLFVATLLPVGMSALYGAISATQLGSFCRLCVGIYASSLGACVFSALAWREAARAGDAEALPWGRHVLQFGEGVLFVAVPLALFLALRPAAAQQRAGCGELVHPEDRYGVRVPLHRVRGGIPAVEMLDPLCPACAHFAHRLEASGLQERLDLQGVLFPLDKECNWMVPESLHPGACAVSEAVLCAGDAAPEVVDWALRNAADLREKGAKSQASVLAAVRARFPNLADCVGRPAVRSRVDKSLRWAVSNSLPVGTPQLFVDGRRLCDEDTDLGLEFSLARLMQEPATRAAGGRP